MTPFFSVIIPLYNKEKYIEATLSSVLKQTFTDFEVIIVDDGSSDNSLKIVSQFNSPKISIIHQKNQGAPLARNNGIRAAQSENIALLDADDHWHPNHLLELINPTITMSYIFHADNSLSKNEYNHIRYDFINHFSEEEKNNPSLKLYLDVNRFAVALRCKMNNEPDLYEKLKSDIDYKNLNLKQKLLLSCPTFILKITKQFHGVLIKNGLYFSAFK